MKPQPNAALSRFLCKVVDTRESECDCAACQRHLSDYVEHRLEGRRLPDALEKVAQHLAMCDECAEEAEALTLILREGEAD